jgi:hypothetical protein
VERFSRYLREHPRAARAYRGAIRSLAAIRGDLGVPKAATSAEVLHDSNTLRRVASAVYDELVGLEESQRKIHGPGKKMTPVRERFPGGPEEVAPYVRATCTSRPDRNPFAATWTQLADELGLR